METAIKDTRCAITLMEHAIHEAGHYILLRILRHLHRRSIRRMRIKKITVVLGYGYGGRVYSTTYLRKGCTLDASSTLEAKEPALLFLLGGLASETLWRYLFGERRVEEGIEDLAPGLDEMLENARVTIDMWDSDVWRELEAIKLRANWKGFPGAPKIEHPKRPTNDIEKVRGLIGDLDWEPYYLKALEVVRKNWPAVLRVAKALVEKRTINAHEAQLAFAGEASK